ncbi:hypothetical protein LQG66_03810 [Bradyrhizobium ontarionense]|uniref:Uncharacterized protein n=1 Tax=Bradyrhizobium ontarionense TaxID=2898149 RepID=A0ABY3RF91_9BRAD|nr:hypothetical protein [Bradyrhizobium sp. A19]UFZ05452.1 hypothetical protein LQG66_03810 [Bradyrhizobium sp. A19]
MSITYPRTDILTAVGFSPPFAFEPMQRQEQSRVALGKTFVKDLGPALWTATYTTEELINDAVVDYQAMLASLDGAIGTFEAWDIRRPWPRLYRTGAAANGTIASVNSNNKALALVGLNAGQVVSRGDYLSFDYGGKRALHQAMETATANGSGAAPQFEVRPYIRAGWSAGAVVNLKAPRGVFALVPGSVQPTQTRGAFGRVTFQVVEALS